MRHVIRMVAVVLTTATVLVGCSGSDTKSVGHAAQTGSSSPGQGSAVRLQKQYERVVAAVLPSIVQITTDGGLGSGVVYDDKGNIVTNDHVVAGAHKIQVTPATGGKAMPATLVGEFAANDLAVVHVDNDSLRPAHFGDSSKVEVGEIVLAMGNPLGLSGSVTNGIISATGRTVSSKGEGAFPGATIPNAVQTSAAINPGNSGGALVTLAEQVVGIPSLTATDPQIGGAAPGIGFAIPSNTVKNIADQLIATGKVTRSGRAALQVRVRTVVDRQGSPAGVGIVKVTAGGAADKAGIRPGDVIVALNGDSVSTAQQLTAMLAKLKPGDQAKVTFRNQNGGKETVTVTLGQLSGD